MCFSATASFGTAAATGVIGLMALRTATSWREIPLASVPLVFAVQQATEGALWLALSGHQSATLTGSLAGIFAFFALAVWPVYSPLAAGLIETNRARQLIMAGLVVLAIPLAAYGAFDISVHPYAVCVVGNTLFYSNGSLYSPLLLGAYLAYTCVPLAISSHRALRWFGAIVIAGLLASTAFYFATRFSVWCFFAALSSVTICLHFAAARRRERVVFG
jgi:hypothetical protein